MSLIQSKVEKYIRRLQFNNKETYLGKCVFCKFFFPSTKSYLTLRYKGAVTRAQKGIHQHTPMALHHSSTARINPVLLVNTLCYIYGTCLNWSRNRKTITGKLYQTPIINILFMISNISCNSTPTIIILETSMKHLGLSVQL